MPVLFLNNRDKTKSHHESGGIFVFYSSFFLRFLPFVPRGGLSVNVAILRRLIRQQTAELRRKMVCIGKAELFGDCLDALVGRFEQHHRQAHPGLQDILMRRDAVGPFEKTDEVLARKGKMPCDVRDAEIFRQVTIDEKADLLHRAVHRLVRLPVLRQKLNEPKKQHGALALVCRRIGKTAAARLQVAEPILRVHAAKNDRPPQPVDREQRRGELPLEVHPKPRKAVVGIGIIDLIAPLGQQKGVTR